MGIPDLSELKNSFLTASRGPSLSTERRGPFLLFLSAISTTAVRVDRYRMASLGGGAKPSFS
jgi:hypothetical protein